METRRKRFPYGLVLGGCVVVYLILKHNGPPTLAGIAPKPPNTQSESSDDKKRKQRQQMRLRRVAWG